MSDLVGNPEDRFSRVAAHFSFQTSIRIWLMYQPCLKTIKTSFPECDLCNFDLCLLIYDRCVLLFVKVF